MIFSLCKPSWCIFPWEIRFTLVHEIGWTLFKIKTSCFPSRDLQVRWMFPSPSTDILPHKPVIGGWLVRAWKVENAERLWQMCQELAESQIQIDNSFIEVELDVAIKYSSPGDIAKNEAWSKFSGEADAFVPLFGFWRLRFLAVVILLLSVCETPRDELVRRWGNFSLYSSSI